MEIKIESVELGVLYFKTGKICDGHFGNKKFEEKEKIEEDLRRIIKLFQRYLTIPFLMTIEASEEYLGALRSEMERVSEENHLEFFIKELAKKYEGDNQA